MTTETLGSQADEQTLIPSEGLISPGGSDPTRFDWREAWYPVHYLADLNPKELTRFTLLDRDLVIWRDPLTHAWRVFADQCPHRLAPLSQGRVNGSGWLECPYHGWAFDGEGVCQRIPQLDSNLTAHSSQRACVRAYPTAERQGLLFVYAGDAERAKQTPIPIVDPLDDSPQSWVCLNTFRDLPYDAVTLLENVLDVSHVPFTHHRSVGNRATAGPVNLEVVHQDRQGFRGTWAEGPRRGTLGRQDTVLIAPNLMWHDLTSKQFGRTLTVVYATPMRKGSCRLFARFPFQFSNPLPKLFIGLTPTWYSHLGQNRILEDDQIFLHDQERYLESAQRQRAFVQACFLPTPADRYIIQWRQWIQEYEADPFPGQQLPPRLSDFALLDRWQSHTQHCQSCRQALARIRQLQALLIGIGVLSLAGIPLELALGLSWELGINAGGVLGAVSGWLLLHRLGQSFRQGHPIPARNLPAQD